MKLDASTMNQREKPKSEVTLADGTGRWHREPKEKVVFAYGTGRKHREPKVKTKGGTKLCASTSTRDD